MIKIVIDRLSGSWEEYSTFFVEILEKDSVKEYVKCRI